MMRLAIGICFLLVLNVVHANWYGPYEISTIEASEGGVYFFKPNGISAFPDPYGCNPAGTPYYVYFDATSKLGDRALSIGLAAQLAGKKVKYYISGCSGSYPKATIIQTNPAW